MEASRWIRFRRAVGAPMIERGLLGWRRSLLISSGVTVAMLLANLAYYIYLFTMKGRSQHYWLSSDELRYLDAGLSGIAAYTEWSLLPVVMFALFVMAPGLACLAVMREGQTRTIDSLIASPLTPHGLHNGFALGALAKLAPWVAPALVVHVAIGLTGLISPLTMLITTAGLAAGAWGMASFGALLGGLYRGRAQSSLMSMGVFGVTALMVGVPTVALESRGEERVFAALSPAAAILHSLVTDGNVVLRDGFERMSPVYDGRLLGVPLVPIFLSIVLMAGLGLLCMHAGSRRFRDPLAPPLGHRAALGAMAFVASFAAVFVAMQMPDMEWMSYRGAGNAAWSLGEHLVGYGFILNCVCLPFVVLFAAGSSQSSAFVARSQLWHATRLADVGSRRADLSAPTQFLMLAAIPLVGAFVLPFAVSGLPMSPADAVYAHRILAVLPWCWGLLGMLGVVSLVQETKAKVWQQALGLVAVGGFGAFTLVYSFVFIDERSLSFRDFAYDGGIHEVVSFLLAMAFLVGPPVLFAIFRWRRTVAERELSSRIDMVVRREELSDAPFAWPARTEVEHITASLRAPIGQAADTERWMAIDGSVLRFWTGSVKRATPGVEIDLAAPFTVTAALQPDRPDAGHASALWMLNLTVASGGRRIRFAVPVAPTQAVGRLPRQDQRLPRLGPRDADAVLGALRLHAEASGTPLPL
jgi:hypothetical protein